MEIHKRIKDNSFNISLNDSYLDYFNKSLQFTKKHYKEDFDRILNTNFNDITPEFFFREFSWVVMASGFNAKIVSKIFPKLMEVNKPLIDVIHGNKNINTIDVAINGLNIINNKRKIKAIIDCSFILSDGIEKSSWENFKNTKLNTPEKLQELPFIGSITCFHLARNIGLIENVKPDLHLNRIATQWGFNSALELCKEIKKDFDLPLGIIDLCLWYSLSTFGSKL